MRESIEKIVDSHKTYEKSEKAKLKKIGIGIHCTDGITRTGFFIINFLMIQSDLCLRQALHIFEISRSPHKFNNNLLIDFLIKEYKGRIEFEGNEIDEKQTQNE